MNSNNNACGSKKGSDDMIRGQINFKLKRYIYTPGH